RRVHGRGEGDGRGRRRDVAGQGRAAGEAESPVRQGDVEVAVVVAPHPATCGRRPLPDRAGRGRSNSAAKISQPFALAPEGGEGQGEGVRARLVLSLDQQDGAT